MWKGKIFKIQKNSNIWLQKEQIKESPTIFREWIKVLKVITRPLEKYSNSLGHILLKYQNILLSSKCTFETISFIFIFTAVRTVHSNNAYMVSPFWAHYFVNSKKIVLKLCKFLPSNLSNLSNQWPYFAVHPCW